MFASANGMAKADRQETTHQAPRCFVRFRQTDCVAPVTDMGGKRAGRMAVYAYTA
jgi:hypothetical protein